MAKIKRTAYTKKSDFILTIGVKLYSKSNLRTPYPFQYFEYGGVKYELQSGEIIDILPATPIFKSIQVIPVVGNSDQPAATLYHDFDLTYVSLGAKIYSNQELTIPFVGDFKITQNSVQIKYTTNNFGQIINSNVPVSARVHEVQVNTNTGTEKKYVWTPPNTTSIGIGTPVYNSQNLFSPFNLNNFTINNQTINLSNDGKVSAVTNLDTNTTITWNTPISGQKILCEVTIKKFRSIWFEEADWLIDNLKVSSEESLVSNQRRLRIWVQTDQDIITHFDIEPIDPYVLFEDSRPAFVKGYAGATTSTDPFDLQRDYMDLINIQVGDTLYKDSDCTIPYLLDLKNHLLNEVPDLYNESYVYISLILNFKRVHIRISDSQVTYVAPSLTNWTDAISASRTTPYMVDYATGAQYFETNWGRITSDREGFLLFSGIILSREGNNLVERYFGNGTFVGLRSQPPHPNGEYNHFIDNNWEETTELWEIINYNVANGI
jgi:hypothetical protein